MTISKINGTIAKCRSVQLSRNNDSVYQTEAIFLLWPNLKWQNVLTTKGESFSASEAEVISSTIAIIEIAKDSILKCDFFHL